MKERITLDTVAILNQNKSFVNPEVYVICSSEPKKISLSVIKLGFYKP